jgi:ribosomal protein L22
MTPDETPETPEEETEAAPTPEAEAAAEEPDAEAPEAEEPKADVAEEKPKPRRRRTRKPAEPKAEAEPGPEAGAEPEPEPEPAEADAEVEPAEAEPEVEKKKTPAKPAAPAPSRRRRTRRAPGEPAPVVRAQAKYVRSSARKARLVCDHIRGKSVEEARAILALTPRAIARDWSKLLESAIANAEHNHELVGEDLYVKAVHADEGPTIKRFRPRAMGRATRIRKRTSHLTILLTPKD